MRKDMDSQLHTLSKIFTERLFRIPDYQRGYAWTSQQLSDFWNDLLQIGPAGNHYTGVLTLERVPPHQVARWEDDTWIVNSKGYSPVYVVDGQQRLTTCIILIQAIIESVGETGTLNYTEVKDIRKKFIFDSKDGGISRSYIFGYEKDNPSYEFLKTRIFKEHSATSKSEETIYTNNLESAKEFFTKRIGSLSLEQIEAVYTKVTQQLLFNIFTISDEVDVCVAFETMNNRGKPLSYLELLKNRLVYLSLKISEPETERRALRSSINECWKEIYHNLGRNKLRPLDDDQFLSTHYALNFVKLSPTPNQKDGLPAISYENYQRLLKASSEYKEILGSYFVPSSIVKEAKTDGEIDLSRIYSYVKSLQIAVRQWYRIFNPTQESANDEGFWLDKLDRLCGDIHLPIALSALLSVNSEEDRVKIFKAFERLAFVLSMGDYPYGSGGAGWVIYGEDAIALYRKEIDSSQLVHRINENTRRFTENKLFVANIRKNFRSRGFYAWSGIKYFLFEYNLSLQERSKTSRPKIYWPEFNERRSDYQTVEHIYPRTAKTQYWTTRFPGLTTRQRDVLRNSLGNLLPLSRPKNSSLSNIPFPEKVEGRGDGLIGFRYGCFAENEVGKERDWGPEQILFRGVKLLTFLEKRWSMNLGSEAEKIEMLGLDFLSSSRRK